MTVLVNEIALEPIAAGVGTETHEGGLYRIRATQNQQSSFHRTMHRQRQITYDRCNAQACDEEGDTEMHEANVLADVHDDDVYQEPRYMQTDAEGQQLHEQMISIESWDSLYTDHYTVR